MVSKMAKIISEGHLPKDHPIYTGRWLFSPSASGFKRPEKRKKTKQRKGPPKGDPNHHKGENMKRTANAHSALRVE